MEIVGSDGRKVGRRKGKESRRRNIGRERQTSGHFQVDWEREGIEKLAGIWGGNC